MIHFFTFLGVVQDDYENPCVILYIENALRMPRHSLLLLRAEGDQDAEEKTQILGIGPQISILLGTVRY